MMVKRKLDGAVDESSVDQEIYTSNATVKNLEACISRNWVLQQVGWQSGRQNLGKA